MVISDLPTFVQNHYELHEWKHAVAVLKNDFPNEYKDIIEILSQFRLKKSDIFIGGANLIKNSVTTKSYYKSFGRSLEGHLYSALASQMLRREQNMHRLILTLSH